MPTLKQIHPLLSHQPFTMLEGIQNPSLLSWNIREAPSTFLRVDSVPIRRLRSHELTTPATRPSVNHLRIRCGLFHDSETWFIEARNPLGVTVQDVLVAIYEAFKQPYSNEAFSTLCPKTQTLVLNAFHARVRATAESRTVWEAGIQRGDCLMRHSWFGGLSVPFERGGDTENTCLLSVRRLDDGAILSSPTRASLFR
ncbi:ectomycorrhiza-regulated small secreted protein [Lentinula aciculospora]|uniref:Ectomycorrhiza-regulated small secreted protein n=1 Tax=Lentinula aciculospora TaxID=153920 RepID=A0A9W9DFX9_9AGAR|nr:ectomycorrhiza-regulated small secreted protein [Lentinula aciculospora]